MPAIELPTLINWIVAGFIGLVFGAASAYLTYRFERRRDDLKWKRELEKLLKEFELQAEQRQKDREQEKSEEESKRIKAQLIQGLDKPNEAIDETLRLLEKLRKEQIRPGHERVGLHPALSEMRHLFRDTLSTRRHRFSKLAIFVGLVLGLFITPTVYVFLAGFR